jgi:hypothetical protein
MPVTVRVHVGLQHAITNGHLRVTLLGPGDEVVVGWAFDRLELGAEQQCVEISLPRLPLRPGVYRWQFALFNDGTDLTGGRLIERWTATPELGIGGTPFGHGQDAWAGSLNIPAALRLPSGSSRDAGGRSPGDER